MRGARNGSRRRWRDTEQWGDDKFFFIFFFFYFSFLFFSTEIQSAHKCDSQHISQFFAQLFYFFSVQCRFDNNDGHGEVQAPVNNKWFTHHCHTTTSPSCMVDSVSRIAVRGSTPNSILDTLVGSKFPHSKAIHSSSNRIRRLCTREILVCTLILHHPSRSISVISTGRFGD